LAKIEGVTPGYSERNFKEAERLIKDYWTKYTEYVSAKMAGELG
jgi:predicted metal-dependent hydrolase